MPRARGALVFVAITAPALVTAWGAARAQGPTPIDLEWSAPAECPGADAVRAAAVRDLGGASVTGPPLVARGRVERSGEAWVAHLSVASPNGSGERTLRAPSCADLADAAALIFALAIDPHAAPPPAPTAPSASAAPTASTAPSPKAPPSSSAQPPSPRSPPPPPSATERRAPEPSLARDGFGVGATLVGDLGLLPAPDLGASVEVFFLRRGLRIGLDGTWLGGTHASAPLPGSGGDFTFLAFGGRVGWEVVLGRFSVGPSLGAELDRMHAEGYGVSSPSSDTGAWVTLRGGGDAAFFLTRGVALFARLEGTVPLSRPTFALEGVGPVHRSATFGGRGGLGAQIVLF